MYKKTSNDSSDTNFWISYADLMAGLLFVFILLVGAIVIKYVFVQNDLKQKELDLDQSKSALMSTAKELDQKNSAIKRFKDQLHALSIEMLQKQALLKQKDELIKEKNETIAKKDMTISAIQDDIKLKTSQITKLKDLLLEYDLNSSNMKKDISELQTKLAKDENILILKDSEIAALGAKLLEKSKEHQALVEELNITKVKIKNLTGIRIKVVDKLRQTLGDSINIDSKSGAIRFSSNILFNHGEYRLKPEAKQELSSTIKKYIQTLLQNSQIRKYIEGITIEGHTDTDGSYLYNLALSQKRALEVMKFIYESDPQNRELYNRYLSASGRSYSDLILDSNGNEDKDASRRIEVKFRIKNEEAIKELENFLNH